MTPAVVSPPHLYFDVYFAGTVFQKFEQAIDRIGLPEQEALPNFCWLKLISPLRAASWMRLLAGTVATMASYREPVQNSEKNASWTGFRSHAVIMLQR